MKYLVLLSVFLSGCAAWQNEVNCREFCKNKYNCECQHYQGNSIEVPHGVRK